MRFNFNNLLNEKHGLKVFYKGESKKQTLLDLNNKVLASINLPKNQTYTEVFFKQKPASKLNTRITWNLVSRFTSNHEFSYLQKPLTSVYPQNSFFYQKKVLRKKRSFLLYRQGFKSVIPSQEVYLSFLKFRKRFLTFSSLSNKLYFLNFHKSTNFVFQKPKISSLGSKIYNIFDKKNKQSKQRVFMKTSTRSESFLYLSILKNLFKKLTFRVKPAKLKLKSAFFFKNLSRLSQKTSQNKKFSRKQLFNSYINLNETIKKKIKKTIKTTSIKSTRSKLLKTRTKSSIKRLSSNKNKKSTKPKKFHKIKIQNAGRNSTEVTSKKIKKLKKSFIKFKLPIKFAVKNS